MRAIAIAVAVLVVALLALPAPRHAVAEWLGISTVHIVRVDSLPASVGTANLGTTLRLGREVPLDEARRDAPFTVLAPAPLDHPTTTYVDEPVAGAVTLVWPPSDRLPNAGDAGVGLLLTELPGSVEQVLLEKRLDPTTTFEIVTVGDARGYWISGGKHDVTYLGPNGTGRPDTTRLAANTLIWSEDGVVFRMESALDRAAAIDLASHLTPL